MKFRDRSDAGRKLAGHLANLADSDAIVFALPKGGVPVAAEVARGLRLPMDVVLVRKLGVPSHAEWGMGAVGEDGTKVLNDSVVRSAGVTTEQIAAAVDREQRVLAGRRDLVRGSVPPLSVRGRTAIVVDDGLATGGTARAACMVLRARGAARIVMAVPVAPPGWEQDMGSGADELVALSTPPHFMGVGEFYEDFAPVSDEMMLSQLVGVRAETSVPPDRWDVELTAPDGAVLEGTLCVPAGAALTAVFAHGSGSSRHSPRNQAVARHLNLAGFGTLLFDLLTREEESSRQAVFDIDRLTMRLSGAVAWTRRDERTRVTAVALFGASTGAAAALRVASSDPDIAAVISRGGRSDLADDACGKVSCPVLMIVGSRDFDIVRLNRASCALIGERCRIEEIPGATHLFEEPGTLDHVANAAAQFLGSLTARARAGR